MQKTPKEMGMRVNREGTVLVVVDVQQRLVPAMDPQVYAAVRQSIRLLGEAAAVLQVPVIVTEQYPAGLGHTVAELSDLGRDGAVEKITFSCCGEEGFLQVLQNRGARQVLLTGMEAHVCVYQTLLDLLDHGYGVHLVTDAICSRNPGDYRAALDLAARAGAWLTTAEIALFQMLGRAGTPEFKTVSNLIKNR